MINKESKIKIYSTSWCGPCSSAKRLLTEKGFSYEEIDIDFDKEAYKTVRELQNTKPRIPTIVFEDGTFLVEPTDVELLEKINSYQN